MYSCQSFCDMGFESKEIRAPVAWLPAGLISWYAPDGSPVALVTSWLALIGGQSPRVRTAWHGGRDSLSRFWPGGDFVLNVPSRKGLAEIQSELASGRLCLTSTSGFNMESRSGIAAVAPRLLQCVVQVECLRGQLVDVGKETELCGDVVRVHRHETVVGPDDIPDLCAIQPLSSLE